jgi:predicted ester cyclase
MIVDLVERFYRDLWNRWDDSAVGEVLAPSFRFRGSLGQTVEGRDAWRGYRDMIRNGSCDFHNEIVDLVVSEQRAAARMEYTGTHTGPLLDLSPTGRRFTYAGAAFFTASANQLTDAWVLGDVTALRAQLRSDR